MISFSVWCYRTSNRRGWYPTPLFKNSATEWRGRHSAGQIIPPKASRSVWAFLNSAGHAACCRFLNAPDTQPRLLQQPRCSLMVKFVNVLLNITVGQHATANLTMSIKRIGNISAAGMGVGDWRSDDRWETHKFGRPPVR